MDSQKQQVVERLKQANNILVTVSSSPSVDQLSACIGLTLALNKLGKHATAVFSGEVPSTIEFLQPEKTLEKNTNSLQDFIIALDKAKADKLRYKVEDRMVKIFITPYRTSISDKDLEFSQGDFNVDVVLALGVHNQQELDQAITSHGRILHDATVISMNVNPGGELGSINWLDSGVSSLSELSVQLVDSLEKNSIDSQIATAFLTGVVAATDRFSNNKTSPETMSISAELMSFGANQQLVATKLQEPAPEPPRPTPIPELKEQPQPQPALESLGLPPVEPPKPKDDGTIEIEHTKDEQLPAPEPPKEEKPEEPLAPQIHIDDQGQLRPIGSDTKPQDTASGLGLPPEPPIPAIKKEDSSRMITEPPSFESSPITANIMPDEDKPALDSSNTPHIGLLNREPLPAQQPEPPQIPSSDPLMGTPASMPWQSGPAPVGNQFGSPLGSASSPFGQPRTVAPASALPDTPPAGSFGAPTGPSPTLAQIEQNVASPHITPDNNMLPPNPPSNNVVAPMSSVSDTAEATKAETNPSTNVDNARNLVEQAINGDPNSHIDPPASLNAQPLNFESAHDTSQDQVDVQLPHLQQPQQPQLAGPQPQFGTPMQQMPNQPVFSPNINPGQPMPGQMPLQQPQMPPVGGMPMQGSPLPGAAPSVPPPMVPPVYPSTPGQ